VEDVDTNVELHGKCEIESQIPNIVGGGKIWKDVGMVGLPTTYVRQ